MNDQLPTRPHGPYLLDNRDDQARSRFDALAGLYNTVTFEHVTRLGIVPGWRCWEVGAGGPTVPGWLAAQVGPTGRVLATDLDVRWLDDATSRRFDAEAHDVAHDDPPSGPFDLVHARLVLVHVPERDRALARMVQALRPGGWLLVEDFDTELLLACPDPDTELEHTANTIRLGFHELLRRRGVDLRYGRKLPRLLRDAGLVDVAADAYTAFDVDDAVRLELANVLQVRAQLVEHGLASAEQVRAHLAALEEGHLRVAMPPLVSAWGRLSTG